MSISFRVREKKNYNADIGGQLTTTCIRRRWFRECMSPFILPRLTIRMPSYYLCRWGCHFTGRYGERCDPQFGGSSYFFLLGWFCYRCEYCIIREKVNRVGSVAKVFPSLIARVSHISGPTVYAFRSMLSRYGSMFR